MESSDRTKRYDRTQRYQEHRRGVNKPHYFYRDKTNRYEDDYYRNNRYHRSTQDRSRYYKNKKRKRPSRPSTPIEGSEEYMTQKIQKTSAIIMRHLLSPEENIIPLEKRAPEQPHIRLPDFIPLEMEPERSEPPPRSERKQTKSIGSNDGKKPSAFNVEEIHNKIMNHLTNLNDGRKKNFISNANSSVFDEAVDHIVKQKRLEISRALRNVCLETSDRNESTEWINSIIPDMGIKIEDLPKEVLEALQMTFSNLEEPHSQLTGEIIKEECEETEKSMEVVEILPTDINTETEPEAIENTALTVETDASDNVAQDEKPPSEKTPTEEVEIVDRDDPVIDLIEEEEEVTFCDEVTQTKKLTVDEFLKINFRKPPKTFSAAVKRMMQIDGYIEKLTEYRQNLFKGLKIRKAKRSNAETANVVLENDATIADSNDTAAVIDLDTSNTSVIDLGSSSSSEGDHDEVHQDATSSRPRRAAKEKAKERMENRSRFEKSMMVKQPIHFEDLQEKMLVLKIFDEELLAGTESGNIYYYSLQNGGYKQHTKVLKVSDLPITCIDYSKEEGKPYLYVGTCDSALKVYNIYSGCLVTHIELEDSIQCMDESFGYLFMGCARGTILRYSIKKNALEYEEKFDSNPIFVLRVTQEGARIVLLIGSRNSTVIVRDAMSGLHLRTLQQICLPTIYSLIIDRHLVYCGTTTHDILVYDFHSGKLIHTFKASHAKGIGCMKVVGKCLIASCYSGKVYVYNLETNNLMAALDGPGGVILSMEVYKDQVIVGTLSCKFTSLRIPYHVLHLY